MAKDKQKNIGQVFTPEYIVTAMLDYCEYSGEKILKMHIIDNSCGDGAFLRVIVRRYCKAAVSAGVTSHALKKGLETFIHGVDTDEEAYNKCLENLTNIVAEYGIKNVKWDIYNQSSLSMQQFRGKMDYVVGNPPYVRVHNLEDTYDEVKQYKFANGGMTDLYLAFFELGFNMLAPHGILCYITPSSWLNSVAALNMRQYILAKKNLISLTDLGHFQPFEHATAYTIISLFSKSHNSSQFEYHKFNGKTHEREKVAELTLEECYIDTYFYLSDKEHLATLRRIKSTPQRRYVSVKNGFATLADNVFIGNDIPDSPITIRTLKASTGKWYKCLYPYDKNGKPLSQDIVFATPAVATHFIANKEVLLKEREEFPGWWEFGRTQALLDVWRDKLALSTLCRTEKDLKLEIVKAGEGIYSGLYVVTDYDIPFCEISHILLTPDFMEYVRTLKKYKSGGYYTFNTKDVEQYINYFLTYNTNKTYVNKSAVSRQDPTLF